MNLAIVHTRSIFGIEARSVAVEVHLSNQLPAFNIVGLPETAVKESKDRVRSAILTSQYEFPCRKIIVNLAPADLPKNGSGLDLAIAIGILAASGQLPPHCTQAFEFLGELALDGSLRGIGGVIPAIMATKKEGKLLFLAKANVEEINFLEVNHVFVAHHLRDVCAHLSKTEILLPMETTPLPAPVMHSRWNEIKGQLHAKYAFKIAAAGGHSLLLSGPPGSGKSMLAEAFLSLLPPLTETQALECAAIHSIQGKGIDCQQWRIPPFRSPHHTASPISLVGGGNPPKPGEISLAHHGVLFLDELPEFNRHVLETLREPLESGKICISRAASQMEFPARFQLIGAMNPCPCGQWGNNKVNCYCSPDKIKRYLEKLSGPFLDRIDMHIFVQPLSEEELLSPSLCEADQEAIRAQVIEVRAMQLKRQGCLNAYVGVSQCEALAQLTEKKRQLLKRAILRFKLSARAYYRLLKVARTISDIQGNDEVTMEALQEALTFKQLFLNPMSGSQ